MLKVKLVAPFSTNATQVSILFSSRPALFFHQFCADKHRLYDMIDTTHRCCNAPNVCAECQRSSPSRRVTPFLLHSACRVAWKGVVVFLGSECILIGLGVEADDGQSSCATFSCGWFYLDLSWTLMSEGHRLFFCQTFLIFSPIFCH